MWLGVACERHLGDLLNETASRRHIERRVVGSGGGSASHLGAFTGVKVT